MNITQPQAVDTATYNPFLKFEYNSRNKNTVYTSLYSDNFDDHLPNYNQRFDFSQLPNEEYIPLRPREHEFSQRPKFEKQRSFREFNPNSANIDPRFCQFPSRQNHSVNHNDDYFSPPNYGRNSLPNSAQAFEIMRKWGLKFSGSRSEDPEAFIVRFNDFVQYFRSRFDDLEFQLELRQEIHHRTQGERERVADFITCMISFFDRVVPRLSEEKEISFVHRNLLPRF